MRPLTMALAPMLALMLATAPAARAQVIDLGPLSDDLGVPPPPAAVANPEAPAALTRGTPRRALPQEAMREAGSALLVPLRPARPRIDPDPVLRMTGETVSRDFVLIMPGRPTDTVELRITHRSGIDALPERSEIVVTVNGSDVASLTPDSFADFRTDAVTLPASVLQTGVNDVRVTIRHTHRIFCGVEAAFALWTEIDTGRSGITAPGARFGADAAGFLGAVSAQMAEGRALPVRQGDGDDAIAELAPFLARLSRALGGTTPTIAREPYWTVQGDRPDRARITILPAGAATAEAAFLHGGDGAVVLALARDADFARVAESMAGGLQNPGAARPGLPMLQPGAPRSLEGLGYDRLTGAGRYLLMDVPFRLPSDWLLLANQKARLDLDYRFAPDLPDGALLQVKVNDTTVRLLPLDRGGGRVLPTLPVSFPTRLLRPGPNRLVFEALIPGDPPDEACPPTDGPVLEIHEGSQLFVPGSPRMSMTDIDLALGALDAGSVRHSASALDLLPAGFAPQLSALLAGPDDVPLLTPGTLTLTTPADLDRLHPVYERDGIRALENVFLADPLAGQPASPADPWVTVDDRGWLGGLFTEGTSGGLLDRAAKTLRLLTHGDRKPLTEWLDGLHGEAMMLQPDPTRPGDLWLVTTPGADLDRLVRSLAIIDTAVERPSGQVAVFTDDGVWRGWEPPTLPLRLLEPVTLSNMTTVAGNFATVLPRFYVLFLFLLTALSAMVALGILLILRGRDR